MSNFGANVYKQREFTTASPISILIALYDGILRFNAGAMQSIKEHNFEKKAYYSRRMIMIISELSATLKHEVYPELCTSLASLYAYLIKRIQDAGMEMQVAPLEEVKSLVEHLRDSWEQAKNTMASNP